MKLAVILFVCGIPFVSNGQYFQYSQYNFTDQRINPALAASSDYASAGFVFRNQDTGASDIHLKSSMVSGVYPLLSRKNGKRWSGIGISLMDDRSGGIFTVQEAALSYAVNIFIDRYQFLSLGFKALYQQQRVNLNGLFTGSQYIRDRGFDQSLFSGENFGLLRTDFATFSSGLYWQQGDRFGRRLAYWGISIFDLNKPQDSFSGVENQLHSTLVASGGIRIYQQDNISLMPEILFTRSASRNVLNVGFITSYEVKPLPNQISGRVDLITKYVPGRSGILGLQFHRDQFSVGFSYDFPVVRTNPANSGAFELGLQIRKLVDPGVKRRKVAQRKRSGIPAQAGKLSGSEGKTIEKTVKKPGTEGQGQIENDSIAIKPNVEPDRRKSLKHKSDSVLAKAQAGRVSHEPFVIEKLNLHFNFEFNSTSLDVPSIKYLDDLSAALNENVHMKVRLTGHTDNIGSADFNMRLSVYRANVIKQYLLEKGIDASRIQTEGKGLAQPLNGNKTDTERALNRRVELLIYYEP